VVSIADAGRADAATAGAIIGRAFADDPVNRWLFGSGPMAPTFTGLARLLYLPQGFVDLTSDGRGAAMWMPDSRNKDLGAIRTLRLAAAMAASAGIGAVRRGLALADCFAEAAPRQRHAYLFAIGVVPDAQGKGLGGALLRHGLARIDRLQRPAYLESTKLENLPLYRHFGFEDRPILNGPDGCPPIYPMWREARP
jgi:ribosomal protein S18 acetylase RimI-like enzyme